MKLTRMVAILAAGVLVAGAMAQGGAGAQGGQRRGGGGGGFGQRMMGGMQGGFANPVMLLGREDVQADLKLTAEQKDKLGGLRDKMQERMREFFGGGGGGNRGGGGGGGGARGGGFGQLSEEQRAQMQKMNEELGKEVNAILTPDQQKRLKQISLQLGGPGVVLSDDVAKELGLTDDQKAKIRDLQTKAREANQALMQSAREGGVDFSEIRTRMQNNQKVLDEEILKVLTGDQKAKLTAMQGPKFERRDQNGR